MKNTYQDTIAAISTALAPSGIGIVRISGNEAVSVADRVFRAKGGRLLSEAESHTLHYGHIEAGGKILDEVLVSVLRAPRTYTREDIVEINCHGGSLVLRRVLEAVLDAGARLAEPGEFTKRAFLNGRIDLTQAEAVMDLIGSENKSAADSALSHLGGAVKKQITALREKLLYETAYIEAALDDPEHYDLTGYAAELQTKLQDIQKGIQKLLDTAEEGRIIKEGIATVILGSPNVGKSTLLNLLSGEERAIVTDIAGTTRDVLEEQVMLEGMPLRLMDTAGLRETGDRIEQIGVEKAKACAEKADLILYLLDGSRPLTEEDRQHAAALAGRKVILIRNKNDLDPGTTDQEIRRLLPSAPFVSISASEGRGLEELAEIIRDLFLQGEIQHSGEVYITNIRHREALSDAFESLQFTLQAIQSGMPEDIYTVDMMDAYASLGRIIGEDVDEDLINEIFSQFCMGK